MIIKFVLGYVGIVMSVVGLVQAQDMGDMGTRIAMDSYIVTLEQLQESGIQDSISQTIGYKQPYAKPATAVMDEQGMAISPHVANREYIMNYIRHHPAQVNDFWSNHTDLVMEYVDSEMSCDAIYDRLAHVQAGGEINNLLHSAGFTLGLGLYDTAVLLSCYMQENNTQTTAHLATTNIPYRAYNITKGMNKMAGNAWKPGETISAYKTVFAGDTYYKDGTALRQVDGKIEEFEVVGGGLCGVSTIMYQVGAKTKGVTIVERHPHSNWYTSYYGNVFGMDATIFGNGATPYKDLKMRNDSQQTILMRPYNYIDDAGKYAYGLTLIAPNLSAQDIRASAPYWNNDKRCVMNTVKGEKVYSCYHNTYGI